MYNGYTPSYGTASGYGASMGMNAGYHDDANAGCNLFIRGLRPDVTEDYLHKLCEP